MNNIYLLRNNHIFFNPLVKWMKFLFILLSISISTMGGLVGQQDTFGCTEFAYLFQNVPTDVFTIDLAVGDTVRILNDITTVGPNQGGFNAVGYNRTDGFIWGYDRSNGEIARLDTNGALTHFLVPELLTKRSLCGDVDIDGKLFLYRFPYTQYYTIDVNPASPGYTTDVDSVSFGPFEFADWAFNPVDEQLYFVNSDGSGGFEVRRIDPLTGIVTLVGPLSGATASTNFGGVYFTANGTFYLIDGISGIIYRVLDPAGGNTVGEFFVQGPVTGQGTDAARCPLTDLYLDFGDAPDSYQSVLSSDGARHQFFSLVTNPLHIGSAITAEDNAPAVLDATMDADDGINVLLVVNHDATSYSMTVPVYNDIQADAQLVAWIDWDGDGTFNNANERTSPAVVQLLDASNVDVTASYPGATDATFTTGNIPDGFEGTAILSWSTVDLGVSGLTYARARLTTDQDFFSDNSPMPFGPVRDGEVEDYRLFINPPPDTTYIIIPPGVTDTVCISQLLQLGNGYNSVTVCDSGEIVTPALTTGDSCVQITTPGTSIGSDTLCTIHCYDTLGITVCDTTTIIIEIPLLCPIAEISVIGDPNILCGDSLILEISITPDTYPGMWSTNGSGTLSHLAGSDGDQVIYYPGENENGDINILFIVDPDSINPLCNPVIDNISIDVQNVDCGSFPWNGN